MQEYYQSYTYAIAGDETLRFIAALKQQADDARQTILNIAADAGATLELTHQRVSFEFPVGATPPLGWKAIEEFGRIQIPPPPPRYEIDTQTAEGAALQKQIHTAQRKLNLKGIFNDACHAAAPCSHLNNYEFSFEELGAVTVIKCPVTRFADRQSAQTHMMPQDCRQISFADYMALKIPTIQEPARDCQLFQNKLVHKP